MLDPSQSPVVETRSGNFSKYASRFDGSPEADVDAFIDAVLTYKDCTNVNEENTLRGLLIHFEGIATTWWRGIKSSIENFEVAVKALRNTYSRKLPVHLAKYFQKNRVISKPPNYSCAGYDR